MNYRDDDDAFSDQSFGIRSAPTQAFFGLGKEDEADDVETGSDTGRASPRFLLAAAQQPAPVPAQITSDSEGASGGSTSIFSSTGQALSAQLTELTGTESSPVYQAPAKYATMDIKITTPAIPQLDLTGPEFIAPPPARRVMAVAPPRGAIIESETILGVASAQITYRHKTPESLWPEPGINICGPEELDRSESSTIHVLTLSILPGERSQGLGGKLLEELLARAKGQLELQHLAARRRKGASKDNSPLSVRAYLEVHPSNTRAIDLYERKGFAKPDGSAGLKKGFYRGDDRIPAKIRLSRGGQDAFIYEKRL